MFDKIWKPHWKNNNKRILWAVLSLSLGLFILLNYEVYTGYLFIGLAAHYAIKYFEYYNHYSNSKIDIQKKIKEAIEEYSKLDPRSFWEFTDEYFYCSANGYENKVTWDNFEGYEIIDATVIAYRKYNHQPLFVLSEVELGKENYEKIIELVAKKLNHE